MLPELLRADIVSAQVSYVGASTLVGWAVLYGVLGGWWWPALVISVATFATGVLRSRTAATTVCLLVETAADLHGATLAEQLRQPLDFAVGDDISALFRKDDSESL